MKRQLIERRQHRRILTLKNFGFFMVFVVIVYAGLSVDDWLRGSFAGGGRLMPRGVVRQDVRTPAQIVTEAPVSEQTSADPLLLAPAAREQEFLSTATPAKPVEPVRTDNAVGIVGDASSITIVRSGKDSKRPVLSGGIFKQQ
jgi:hypothetical protein